MHIYIIYIYIEVYILLYNMGMDPILGIFSENLLKRLRSNQPNFSIRMDRINNESTLRV